MSWVNRFANYFRIGHGHKKAEEGRPPPENPNYKASLRPSAPIAPYEPPPQNLSTRKVEQKHEASHAYASVYPQLHAPSLYPALPTGQDQALSAGYPASSAAHQASSTEGHAAPEVPFIGDPRPLEQIRESDAEPLKASDFTHGPATSQPAIRKGSPLQQDSKSASLPQEEGEFKPGPVLDKKSAPAVQPSSREQSRVLNHNQN